MTDYDTDPGLVWRPGLKPKPLAVGWVYCYCLMQPTPNCDKCRRRLEEERKGEPK